MLNQKLNVVAIDNICWIGILALLQVRLEFLKQILSHGRNPLQITVPLFQMQEQHLIHTSLYKHEVVGYMNVLYVCVIVHNTFVPIFHFKRANELIYNWPAWADINFKWK